MENRIEYDSRTNQLIGFVLPTDECGMPQPFAYKAETAIEIIEHFANEYPEASCVNTIMAQPIGKAPTFCLLIFGTNNTYIANDVSKRWSYVKDELKKIGIGSLVISSDGDPKFLCAMRVNSELGHKSGTFFGDDLFKIGHNLEPPFYVQDGPHVGTRGRNQLLTTWKHSERFPFGNGHFIQIHHLQFLIDRFDKHEHNLTANILNPSDHQNFKSVLRICDSQVINMLRLHVKGSEATAVYLELISNAVQSFCSEDLLPLERIEKMWHSVFIARIWRYFVTQQPNLKLKDNFISSNLYASLEQNAHSLVLIIQFLKRENLSHLFVPWLFNSQACEQFYAKIRSLCSTFSMVATCNVKEAVNRVSKINLLNEIADDEEFFYPKSNNRLFDPLNAKGVKYDLPSEDEILLTIQKSQTAALNTATKFGLINKTERAKTESCACQIKPCTLKIPESKKNEKTARRSSCFLSVRSLLRLKNYANKFKDTKIDITSSYVEIPNCKKRLITRKGNLCALLRRETKKSSSERLLRVRGGISKKKNKTEKKQNSKKKIKQQK